MTPFQTALHLFDDYNKQDPHTIEWDGQEIAAEYFYARQLYAWVKKLAPHAGEHLLLASRAQHIGRWKTPRNSYPAGKAGYLNWRKDLAKFHAGTTGELMRQAGYGHGDIEAVQHIILKKDLRSDKEVQVMEDALCLVFLEFQFETFMLQHNEEKVSTILKKTWGKMSNAGRTQALHLSLNPEAIHLIKKALA